MKKKIQTYSFLWSRNTHRVAKFSVAVVSFFMIATMIFRSEDVQHLLIGQPDRRDVEIFNSSLRGYSNNRLHWVIKAKQIWSQGNKTVFKLSGLTDGQLYDDDGRIVIQHLMASNGETNIRSKVISLYSVSAELGFRPAVPLHGLLASEKPARRVRVDADEMHYFGTSKRTFLQGNVAIYQGKFKIVPKNGLQVDNATNTAFITEGFTIYYDRMVITGNTMTIHMDDEYSEVPDGIRGIRSAIPTGDPELDPRENRLRKLPTEWVAEKARFSSKNGEDVMTLEGGVEIIQPDKTITTSQLEYDDGSDVLTLQGKVVIKNRNLLWALKPGKIIKNDDIRKTIAQPSIITGSKAIFEGGTKRGRIIGNVKIEQDSQTIESQKMEYDDNPALLRFTGNVVFEKTNSDTLRCSELTIDLDNEEMLARRSISTEFKLKKKPNASN